MFEYIKFYMSLKSPAAEQVSSFLISFFAVNALKEKNLHDWFLMFVTNPSLYFDFIYATLAFDSTFGMVSCQKFQIGCSRAAQNDLCPYSFSRTILKVTKSLKSYTILCN